MLKSSRNPVRVGLPSIARALARSDETGLWRAYSLGETTASVDDVRRHLEGNSLIGDGIAVGIPAVTDGGHIRRLEEVEADMIRMALQRYRGQMSEVARKLGIGRSTLYRKMRGLGLEAKM